MSQTAFAGLTTEEVDEAAAKMAGSACMEMDTTDTYNAIAQADYIQGSITVGAIRHMMPPSVQTLEFALYCVVLGFEIGNAVAKHRASQALSTAELERLYGKEGGQ